MLEIQWNRSPPNARRVVIDDDELVVLDSVGQKLCTYTLHGMLSGVATVKLRAAPPAPPSPCPPTRKSEEVWYIDAWIPPYPIR